MTKMLISILCILCCATLWGGCDFLSPSQPPEPLDVVEQAPPAPAPSELALDDAPQAALDTESDSDADFEADSDADFEADSDANFEADSAAEPEDTSPLVPLDETLIIEGFVVDADNAPIPEAAIEVCTPSACITQITADLDGHFVTDPLFLDLYEVRATALGFALSSAQGVVPGGPALKLSMSQGGALTGRAATADGQGVQATIHLGGAGLFPPRVVRADAQGQFAVWGLEAGRYELLAFAGDLGSAWPVAVKVEKGAVAGHADVLMKPGHTLNLQVRGHMIAIGGGVSEASVEGALVTLASDPLHVLALHDISDSRGEVRFTGLPAGRYHVGVRAPGYLADKPRWVNIPAAGPVAVVLDRGVTVEGQAINRAGDPIAGAKITAYIRTTEGAYWILDDDRTGVINKLVRPDGTALTGGAKRFVTNGQGRFSISGLPPGEVSVEAAKPGLIPDRTQTVTLAEGEISTGHTLSLLPGILVEGEIQHADGSPLVGAQVRWRREADVGFWRAQVRSTSGGLFRFDAVSEDVVFEVLAPGYAPLLAPMHLEGVSQRVVLRFEAGEGSVFGQVLGPDGGALVGADISAWEPENTTAAAKCRARTDKRGVFQLMRCGQGRRLVEVRGPSAAPAWALVETGQDLEVRLSAGGTLSAQVLDTLGAPIPRVRVKAVAQIPLQDGSGGSHRWVQEWLIQAGRWEQPYMPPGTYTLTFSAEGFGAFSTDLEVREGEAVHAGVVELAPLRQLEGFVMDYYRAPAAGARIWVVGTKASATVDAQGRFLLTLPPDTDDGVTLEAVHWQYGRGLLTLGLPLPTGAPEDVQLTLNRSLEDGQEDWRARLSAEGVGVSVDGKARVVVSIQGGSVWLGAGLKEGDFIESLTPDAGFVESITVVRGRRRSTLKPPSP